MNCDSGRLAIGSAEPWASIEFRNNGKGSGRLRNKMFTFTCNLKDFPGSGCFSATKQIVSLSPQSINLPKMCRHTHFPPSLENTDRKLLFLSIHETSNSHPVWGPHCQTVDWIPSAFLSFLAVCFLTPLLTDFKHVYLEILLG